MKKLWNKIVEKLPRLPRKWRIVRNLAAVLILALLVPTMLDWPPLTQYGAFRKLEAGYLLTPSELVLRVKSDRRRSAFLTEGEGWITVGKTTKMDYVGTPFDRNEAILTQVLPKEGLTVVAMPVSTEDRAMVVAVTGAPEGALSGVLELDLKGELPATWLGEYDYQADETFTARAEREENGWFFFYLEPHPEEERCAMDMMWWGLIGWLEAPEGYAYRLTLLDQDGEQAAYREDTLPENQTLWGF